MWLLSAFILAAGFSSRSAQVLQQSPVSITKPVSKTVLINCWVPHPDFSNLFIHWYRQRPNAAPQRIAYKSSTLFLENKSDEGKFSIEKDPIKSVCTLTVSKVTLQDSATYYCARWDAQQLKAPGDLRKDVLGFLNQVLKCGQAQVLLKQRQVSVTRGQTKTAWIECAAQGINDFQSAYIHWYRHVPAKAPERILYIGPGQVSYDDDSYRSKYSSFKKDANICTFLVHGINADDE
ncbi:PREDICTED: uncharacterized protein LOC104164874, partial [Cariama cristata]|uniref:uncharacterized protein LOC104164874 n=1 Tax=Cariama cristata TaxID=54380 RepID=UPI00052035D6